MNIFDDAASEPRAQGFADGWTAFPTEAGLDILLRTSSGESKGRLAAFDADGNLIGEMFEPGAPETARPIRLLATIVNDACIDLRCGNRVWQLRQPKGKAHFFAFLNQWPAKAEPVAGLKAMMAALKKKP